MTSKQPQFITWLLHPGTDGAMVAQPQWLELSGTSEQVASVVMKSAVDTQKILVLGAMVPHQQG